jgi:hypothetical protein
MAGETNKPAPEQNPSKGGSYVRQPDGALQLKESTQPAKPALSPEPKPSAPATKE